MAKISTYPFPSPPSASDYVIGTDTNDALATKNFMISDILALGGTTYVPYTGAVQDVDLGSFSLYTYSLYMNGGSFYDGNGSPGSMGEILSSQGPGNSPIWVDLSTLAGAYVPYTGATGDVDLGSYSLYTYSIILQGGTIIDGNNLEGTLGQVLTSQGPGNMPLWQDVPVASKNYGSFYTNSSQIIGVVADKLKLDSVAYQNGISVISDGANLTQITFSKTGIYSMSFIGNLFNSSGSKHYCGLHLNKNGTTPLQSIANSNNTTYVEGNSILTFNVNWMVDVVAGDYIYLYFYSSDTSLFLAYISGTPNGSSVRLNVIEI